MIQAKIIKDFRHEYGFDMFNIVLLKLYGRATHRNPAEMTKRRIAGVLQDRAGWRWCYLELVGLSTFAALW